MRFLNKHDLLRRVLRTVVILVVFLLGQKIILPGINPAIAKTALHQQTFLQMLGVVVGGQFNLPTLFSLGMGPYMTSLIVWQAVTSLNWDPINHLSVSQVGYIQKTVTLILAILQGILIVRYLRPALVSFTLFGMRADLDQASMLATFTLVVGAMFSVFLGEQNADKGLGGSSMLILPGILLGLPNLLASGWGKQNYPLSQDHLLIAFFATILFVSLFVFLLKIEVQILVRRPLLEGPTQQSYLPFKLLIAGAMPFMFSTTLFMLPRNVIEGNSQIKDTHFGQMILKITDYQTLPGIAMYGLTLIMLTFVFGFITIQPLRLAKQMKENNEYIYNIFPGDETERYLMRRFVIMAFLGGLCLAVLGMIPMILGIKSPGLANYTMYFGSLAILVTLIQVLADQVSALYSKNHYYLF